MKQRISLFFIAGLSLSLLFSPFNTQRVFASSVASPQADAADVDTVDQADLAEAVDSVDATEAVDMSNAILNTVDGIELAQTVSREPLLGGTIAYRIRVSNKRSTGDVNGYNRVYNLNITDTLPAGLTYSSADLQPNSIMPMADGSTVIVWKNIVDLERAEYYDVSLTAKMGVTQTIGVPFTNTVDAQVNNAPDNSADYIDLQNQLQTQPQALDMQMSAVQSTATRQATGAGEYPSKPGRVAGADWAYQYAISVKNNRISDTTNVAAAVLLPAGVAYLGNPRISNNVINATAVPSLTLQNDGSLQLSWNLGTLTSQHYTTPVTITFDAAIPYRYRTVTDTVAQLGGFAGPMSGGVIPEDMLMSAGYNATGFYAKVPTADGTIATPYDDSPATVTSKYVTLNKSSNVGTVGIGTKVTYALRYAVSEYYNATGVVISDTLPDGMTYVDGSATVTPTTILADTPITGQTTIAWSIPATSTKAGSTGLISFLANVEATYKGPPRARQPVVAGDTLVNNADIAAGDWASTIESQNSGAINPNPVAKTVNTQMPTFTKQVFDVKTGQWTNASNAFTGDTALFRLTFNAPPTMNAKSIVIRDYLPRGMTLIDGSAAYSMNGVFGNGVSCVLSNRAYDLGTLSGLQYLEWRLCDVSLGSTWQVTVSALVGDLPNVEPDWLVGNFGKLSGMNSYGKTYSQRDFATVDYTAPHLMLTKSASPDTNLSVSNTVIYTVAVQNTGDAVAYNLVLTDVLPVNLNLVGSGRGTPSASNFTVMGGTPATGNGGEIRWTTVPSLAVGATQYFVYSGTIKNGVVAGEMLSNLASVAYNSRADNAGHFTPASSNVAADNTDAKQVYVRGLTYKLAGYPAKATIGDVTHWTLTMTVPAGTIAYWPVAMLSLPDGLAQIGTPSVVSATLDTVNHSPNPMMDGIRELRFFLNTLDNQASNKDATVLIKFDTLATGYKPGQPNSTVWSNCCQGTATVAASAGWYDNATGYNGQGFAWHGYEFNRTTRLGAKVTASVAIVQPNIKLSKSADHSILIANDVVTYSLIAVNAGQSPAYDVVLTDSLPAGLTLIGTTGMTVTAPLTATMTNTNPAGASNLSYGLDVLPVGATWRVTMTVRVDPTIAAGISLINNARSTYSSEPGVPGDLNSDGLADERTYATTASHTATTVLGSIRKYFAGPGRMTYGERISYTLMVPAEPVNATMYNVFVTDVVDSRLLVTGVSTGTFNGNSVSANLGNIAPNQKRVVYVYATLPSTSAAKDGDVISNTAQLAYSGRAKENSNTVAVRTKVPALVVNKWADVANVKAGDSVAYTITVANVGTGPAYGLRLTDTLPSNIRFVTDSASLNGLPLGNPTANAWVLPSLDGLTTHTVSFRANVLSAVTGTAYVNTAIAIGFDAAGQRIPANNISRVKADVDNDDTATARVYGPMAFQAYSTLISYEDLKNVGWSDWDYNDFVVRVAISRGLDVNGGYGVLIFDYEALARGAGYNHTLKHKLPIAGNSRAQLTVWDAQGNLVSSRMLLLGAQPIVDIFGRTRQALPPPQGSLFTNTPADQQTFIPGYKARLVLVMDTPSANLDKSLAASMPWDAYIYVLDTKQEVHLAGPGRGTNSQLVNGLRDAHNPMIGYNLPLAQTYPNAWDWPIEQAGIWRAYPQYVNAASRGFTAVMDWSNSNNAMAQYVWANRPKFNFTAAQMQPLANEPTSRYFGNTVAANLDGGSQSIIVGNLLANRVEVYNAPTLDINRVGWPQATDGGVKAAPAVADLNGDGAKEIIAGTENGLLYAWSANGQAVAGFPVRVGANPTVTYRILATPAVADLDNDGTPEIVVALSDGRLYVFAANGTEKWSVSLGDAADTYGNHVLNGAPVIGDIDGDGKPEIVIGSMDDNLYVFNANGTPRWRFATQDNVVSTPTIADVISGTAGSEIVFSSMDGNVYIVDKDGNPISQFATGWSVQSSPLLADLDGDGQPEIVVGSDDTNVWAWHLDGSLVDGWPQATGAPVVAAPAWGDVDGDGTSELVAGSDDGSVYAWHANGERVAGWPKMASASVKGAVALANLDSDPTQELVVGDFAGSLNVWNLTYPQYFPVVSR